MTSLCFAFIVVIVIASIYLYRDAERTMAKKRDKCEDDVLNNPYIGDEEKIKLIKRMRGL